MVKSRMSQFDRQDGSGLHSKPNVCIRYKVDSSEFEKVARGVPIEQLYLLEEPTEFVPDYKKQQEAMNPFF